MVYTFIKRDNTVAALDIPSFVTVKIIAMNKNQCHAEGSLLGSHQLLSYAFNSLSFTEHVSSLLLSPQPDWPNFFNPSTFCSHIYSSLKNIPITVHMFNALQTQCWHTKMRDQKNWDSHKPRNPLSNTYVCSKVWESEFHYLWQQQTCHLICSLVYIYITAPKSRVDCSLWLTLKTLN